VKLFLIGFVINCYILFPTSLVAQEKQTQQISKGDTMQASENSATPAKSPVQQIDVTDLISELFKKGPSSEPKKDSITSKPAFTAVPAVGYTLNSGLVATISGNVVFKSPHRTKISTITSSAAYSQKKQFTMPVESSIWTKGDKYNLIGDYRFYKYPQSTFGLGSNSDIENEFEMDYSYFRFYEVILRQITENFFAGAGYIFDYHWNISEKNTKNALIDDYRTYGAESHTLSTGVTLNALYDRRNNPINPSKGFYTAVQLRNNLQALGSTRNWQSLILDVRKYVRFPAKSENVFAFWSYDWLILHGKPPYLDLPSNSWDSYSSTGRGYIQGRFRGVQMVYAETEYRFKITRNGLFGGVLFVNAETFSSTPGSRLQGIQPGFGPGLRIKLNKVSKTNISIDYGFGTQGSKGLFINIGEMF
jgi:outer membrane protein assembly factor BamA